MPEQRRLNENDAPNSLSVDRRLGYGIFRLSLGINILIHGVERIFGMGPGGFAGGLLITALVFGTGLRSDWTTIGIQMIYAITYCMLLMNRADNYFSVNALLWKHARPSA
jgi:hypothetical protein